MPRPPVTPPSLRARAGTISDMNSGVRLCPSLTPKDKCIWVQEYSAGQFIELYHEHVPAHKIAGSRHWALLRALVLRYEEATGGQIVDAYLTRRGRAAKQYHPHDIVVEGPESGVNRWWCSGHGGRVSACIDTVVWQEAFRTSTENQKI